ncbi:hypothetical protein CGRA01v4_12553 [Colletotrichum graminicola]|uniref:DUF7029 domain-containing protein n=1 Tax=Colletotrichum graminicola (strain M1.001 / M2 / FGSC 10212) TaxID=645133 RepID=E3QIE8_COLGM|nr:uncharacterized protein GLRG_05702 [Colletotrichum graminicola M1.001]EFQ30558.1 hypothetical protein GLRG_05702 [Colletotrichum graminicola M1.001]WDK21264.1 hypothetical protein CGRA01v4_12553 [Colletotrichum graminicola]
MVRSTLAGRLLACLLLATGAAAHADGCGCAADGVKRVTYIIVEMPDQPELAAADVVASTLTTLSTITPTPTPTPQIAHAIEDIPAYVPVVAQPEQLRPAVNTTHTFGPTTGPNIDTKDPVNIVPATNVSLSYAGAGESADQDGSIDMSLAFKNPAVVLEHVDAVKAVVCGDDELTVAFSDADAFHEAVQGWTASADEGGFILITNHLGNCDAEFERGFFMATGLTADEDDLTVTVAASKEELANIAGSCEMAFTSLPAATLARRLTLDPSYSLSFAQGLANNTVLFSDGQYVNITADEAWFSSNITFSGYLKYNFWGFKVEALYFDLDATFDSAVGVSVDVLAAYSHSLKYAPDALSYSLVTVPGVVELGPGVAFAVGLDLNVSAAVGVTAGLSVGLPAGKVHLDLLDFGKSSATGWDPVYSSHANITESADVHVNTTADVTVRLAIDLLGGLVDLSAGITATPGFDNTFKLRGDQKLGLAGNFTSPPTEAVADVPKDGLVCAEKNGVEFATDFTFNLTGFATKYWSGELYSVRVPLWDVCYSF